MTSTYNERLFSGYGPRSAYHLSRYKWVTREIRKLGSEPLRIVELGCFDAKLLDFIISPSYYLGLDAGWENGLAIGQHKWAERKNIELLYCTSPEQIPEHGTFDLGVCMETLEHMSYELADAYLAKLSRMISGTLFITVPNEHGLVFAAKHAAKIIARARGKARYSPKDAAMLIIGRTSAVERNEHKGFDYRVLADMVSRHFSTVTVTGIFPSRHPTLSMTIGIIAKNSR